MVDNYNQNKSSSAKKQYQKFETSIKHDRKKDRFSPKSKNNYSNKVKS